MSGRVRARAKISQRAEQSESAPANTQKLQQSLAIPLCCSMSEFASLLASFKQSAATASSNPPSRSQTSTPNEQHKQNRKRPHAIAEVKSPLSCPLFHSYMETNKDFELSFLVIGAQKAGTSWSHALLRRCDRIALPRDQKEVHFWDWHIRKGLDWYIRQFDYSRKDASSHLYGEITPCYVVLPPSTIAQIHKCFPDLKVIFVARDLVDRAWSAITMELRNQTMGLKAGEFAEGDLTEREQKANKVQQTRKATISVAQQRRLQQQSSPSSHPDSFFLDRLRSEIHSSRSDYATHLANWFMIYPAK